MTLHYFSDGTPCECNRITHYDGTVMNFEVARPSGKEKAFRKNGKIVYDLPGFNTNGNREGTGLEFSDNGFVAESTIYKDGQKHGIRRCFNIYGVLDREILYIRDEARFRVQHKKPVPLSFGCSMENFI